MPVHESNFSISLRIWHPARSSKDLIQMVGVNALHARNAGESRTSGDERVLGGVYNATYCTFRLLNKVSGNFVDGIDSLHEQLMALRATLELIRAENGRCELFVGVFSDVSSGFVLETSKMLQLVDLRLDLVVEYYA